MELSSLLDKIKKTSPEEPQLFLAIQIDSEFVKSAIWSVEDQTTKILALGGTQEWDGSSSEILLEAIDASLTPALESLPPEVKSEPNQVIFGLPATWVGPEGVTPARLTDLKHTCEKLDLQPVGFVVAIEAITHYLKAKEGTPLSAILIHVSATEVDVTVVRLGKIEGTHVVGRSGDLSSDVREGLTRFDTGKSKSGQPEKQASLPTRMILYDGHEDMQDQTQQLMAFDWQSQLPFLHLPQIETMPESFSISAIAMAGGSEVAKSLGFTIKKIIKPPSVESDSTSAGSDSAKASFDGARAESDSDKAKSDSTETPQPDLTSQKADTPSTPQPSTPTPAPKIEGEPTQPITTPDQTPTTPETRLPSTKPRLKLPSLSLVSNKLGPLLRPLLRLPGWVLNHLKIPKGSKLIALIGIALLLLASTGVVFLAKRLPRALVRVTFASRKLDQRLRITVDPTAQSIDPNLNLLPAEKVTLSKSGKISKDTSGNKTVGDRATGEVVIFNRRTDGGKTFAEGTTITTDNLSFSLDSEVNVASASSSVDDDLREIITPGKATVAVTADAIGPDYNLDADQEFQVGSFSKSVYIAKNESALTGGTKHEIKTVSKKDQDNLKESLIDKLKSEAADETVIEDQGRRVFKGTSLIKVTDEEFSSSVGDEASSLTLEMTVDITSLAISDEDLNNLLSASLRNAIPEGFSLAMNDLEITEENVETEDDSASFDAIIKAKLSPSISQKEITDLLTGKRPEPAIEELMSLSNVENVELEIKPNLPKLLRWIPVKPDRIDVEIKLKD